MATDYKFCISLPFSPQGMSGPSIKQIILFVLAVGWRVVAANKCSPPPPSLPPTESESLPEPSFVLVLKSRQEMSVLHFWQSLCLKSLCRVRRSLPSDPWSSVIWLPHLPPFSIGLRNKQCEKATMGQITVLHGLECSDSAPLPWCLPPQLLKQEIQSRQGSAI